MTIGAPTVLKASENGFAPPLLFIVGMYVSMIGAKISIATLVGKSRKFMSSSIYKNLIRALGLVLLIFALYFIREALIAFGII